MNGNSNYFFPHTLYQWTTFSTYSVKHIILKRVCQLFPLQEVLLHLMRLCLHEIFVEKLTED